MIIKKGRLPLLATFLMKKNLLYKNYYFNLICGFLRRVFKKVTLL